MWQKFNPYFVMKKTSVLRPVSQKAYMRFVERINLVITDPAEREVMLVALDRYLDGDRETYDCGLTSDCALAFEMLRFDIDLAIARSTQARMRARKRKESVAEELKPTGGNAGKCNMADMIVMLREVIEKHSAEHESGCDDSDDGEDNEEPFVAPKTRRQRRAEVRSSRPKSRWRRL